MSSDNVREHDLLHRFDLETSDLERALWILVAISLVGDVMTTFVGLSSG